MSETNTPATIPVEIVSRRNATRVLFRAEVDASIPLSGRVRVAVEIAVKSGADLDGADLRGANLGGANLNGANLNGASLNGASLKRASLNGASLKRASLIGASLKGASLDGASLDEAILNGASLDGANLNGASLDGVSLDKAHLSPIKQDFLAEVLRLPNELEYLRDALIAGKVDGSIYSGPCACLAGTLAKARGIEDYEGDTIGDDLAAFHANAGSPRERFFMAINAGDTPATNQVSAIALGWTNEAIAVRDMIRATAPVAEAV